MVENVGVAVGIASPALSDQKLFPLPVSTSGSVVDSSGFRCRPMSCNVDSAISESGIVENVGVAFGIGSPALSVQKCFPLPVSASGSVADISGFRCRQMSGNIDSAIFESA